MQRLEVFGPPTLLFYTESATNDMPDRRLVGAIDTDTLLHALRRIGANTAS